MAGNGKTYARALAATALAAMTAIASTGAASAASYPPNGSYAGGIRNDAEHTPVSATVGTVRVRRHVYHEVTTLRFDETQVCEDGDVESVDGVTYTVHGLVIGFKNGHAVFGLNKVSASGARKIVINGTFSGKTASGTIRVTERRRSTSLTGGLGALDINGPAVCSTGTDPFSIKH